MAFGALPADSNPLSGATGTPTPQYSATRVVENPGVSSFFSTITAMPAYNRISIEELRVQDYGQNRKTAGGTHKWGFATFASPKTTSSGSVFGAPNTFVSTLAPQKPLAACASTSGTDAPCLSGAALDPGRLQRMEEILGKSLLGEELVNTQFHLFSAKSLSTGRVMKPRVLYANNVLLSKSSKYFLDLLSADIDPSNTWMVDLTGDNDIPTTAQIDDYGYDSDSDLDDCDDPTPAANSRTLTENHPGNGNKSSEVDSNVGQPSTDELSSETDDQAKLAARGEEKSKNQIVTRLGPLRNRHILVKDTAFQTWYTLLNYLYTGKFGFLPLTSTVPGGKHVSSNDSADGLKCSAKSMYRLASRVGLDHLRHVALAHIRNNLTEHNILKEISSTIVSKHSELLETELDILYSYIASGPVATDFSSLAQRIAHNELPHGTDIITGIHTRLLKDRHPFSLAPAPFAPRSSPSTSKQVIPTVKMPKAKGKDKRASRVDGRHTPSGSEPSESESTYGTPTPASADIPALAASSAEETSAGEKNKTEARK